MQNNSGNTGLELWTRALAILLWISAPLAGQLFPAVVSVDDLDGENGFALIGPESSGRTGISVAGPGDFNGDGHQDLFIGSSYEWGRVFVVFGGLEFPAEYDLSLLAEDGVEMIGENSSDTGQSLGVGNYDGDGRTDLVVGAPGEWPGGNAEIAYGRRLLSGELHLDSLRGRTGFSFSHSERSARAGTGSAFAGDLNGDGLEDVVVGAPEADLDDISPGKVYVIFGTTEDVVPEEIQDLELDGTNGFAILGVTDRSDAGREVSSAGDLNGDGFDDLLIGAEELDVATSRAGAVYVVFGNDSFEPVLDLAALDGTNGFVMIGDEKDKVGAAVAALGDINGDGRDDVAIGAPNANDNGPRSGKTYVIFGAEQFPARLELKELTPQAGFTALGEDPFDESGSAVAAAGDLNGDGRSDLAIGASYANSSRGRAYVVFARDSYPATLEVGALTGATGFTIEGREGPDSRLGWAVASAGDFDEDGFDDLLLGSPEFRTGASGKGAAYVVYGRQAAVPVAPEVRITGSCPGEVTVEVMGMTPRGEIELFSGVNVGGTPLDGGWCGGTSIELEGAASRAIVSADNAGQTRPRLTLPDEVCGTPMQLLDRTTCETTAVAFWP